jgi:hypothetical protein
MLLEKLHEWSLRASMHGRWSRLYLGRPMLLEKLHGFQVSSGMRRGRHDMYGERRLLFANVHEWHVHRDDELHREWSILHDGCQLLLEEMHELVLPALNLSP